MRRHIWASITGVSRVGGGKLVVYFLLWGKNVNKQLCKKYLHQGTILELLH